MAEVEFNDFLAQLGKDTVSRIKNEQSKVESKTEEIEESADQIKQNYEPKQDYVEHVQTEERTTNSLDEEFFAQALDYANIVLKSVRDSFESKEEKRKVCESIRNAMNFYLGESNTPTRVVQPKPQEIKPQMTEKDWNNIPTIQKSEPIQETPESVGYTNDNKMSLKNDNSVDLSKVTNEDISDFRVLAGIV